jgi:hypothetical protein
MSSDAANLAEAFVSTTRLSQASRGWPERGSDSAAETASSAVLTIAALVLE